MAVVDVREVVVAVVVEELLVFEELLVLEEVLVSEELLVLEVLVPQELPQQVTPGQKLPISHSDTGTTRRFLSKEALPWRCQGPF